MYQRVILVVASITKIPCNKKPSVLHLKATFRWFFARPKCLLAGGGDVKFLGIDAKGPMNRF